MHRNLRPNVLTIPNCVGSRQFGQIGGKGFFGITLTLFQGVSLALTVTALAVEITMMERV
jgi:hypothetical protein